MQIASRHYFFQNIIICFVDKKETVSDLYGNQQIFKFEILVSDI